MDSDPRELSSARTDQASENYPLELEKNDTAGVDVDETELSQGEQAREPTADIRIDSHNNVLYESSHVFHFKSTEEALDFVRPLEKEGDDFEQVRKDGNSCVINILNACLSSNFEPERAGFGEGIWKNWLGKHHDHCLKLVETTLKECER